MLLLHMFQEAVFLFGHVGAFTAFTKNFFVGELNSQVAPLDVRGQLVGSDALVGAASVVTLEWPNAQMTVHVGLDIVKQ